LQKNFYKIRQNIIPEYEANIILLANLQICSLSFVIPEKGR
jgi:hypothetical protein